MEKKQVKKYILDNVLTAVLYAGVAIAVPFAFHERGIRFVLVIEVVWISAFALGFRRIFFFPFDLLFGKVTREVSFAYLYAFRCDIFTKCYFPNWNVRLRKKYGDAWEKEKRFTLVIPMAMTAEEIDQMEEPQEGTRLRITYYPLSGILLHYERI